MAFGQLTNRESISDKMLMLELNEKKSKIKHNSYERLQYISLAPFEKDSLKEIFSDKIFGNES
jgi:hypothetical protein